MAALRADHFRLIYVFIPSKSHKQYNLRPRRIFISARAFISIPFAAFRPHNHQFVVCQHPKCECQCTQCSVRSSSAMALHWHIGCLLMGVCLFVAVCAVVVGR